VSALSDLRDNHRVEIVDDERAIGNGLIITLRAGWSFDPTQDNRVAGADTVQQAQQLVRSARPFNGTLTP
jgi:hypothetical protein